MTKICTTFAILCIIGILYAYSIDEPVKIQKQDLLNCSTAGAIGFLLLAIIGWKVRAIKNDN